MPLLLEGQLEINDNGVLYFHSNKTGTSFLRICGLPIDTAKHINKDGLGVQLDITLKGQDVAKLVSITPREKN